jgi:hypothetical protein
MAAPINAFLRVIILVLRFICGGFSRLQTLLFCAASISMRSPAKLFALHQIQRAFPAKLLALGQRRRSRRNYGADHGSQTHAYWAHMLRRRRDAPMAGDDSHVPRFQDELRRLSDRDIPQRRGRLSRARGFLRSLIDGAASCRLRRRRRPCYASRGRSATTKS